MKRVIIPSPPRLESFRSDQDACNRAIIDWMDRTKQALENASKINDAPLDQNMVVSAYTTNTALTGTSTLGDVANFLCTLIAAMQRRGLISPTPTTGV